MYTLNYRPCKYNQLAFTIKHQKIWLYSNLMDDMWSKMGKILNDDVRMNAEFYLEFRVASGMERKITPLYDWIGEL